MYRIYFDGNAGDGRDRYDLGLPGSLADIEPLADHLADGMHVILYDDEEPEVEAVLEFEPRYPDIMSGWRAPCGEHCIASKSRRSRPPLRSDRRHAAPCSCRSVGLCTLPVALRGRASTKRTERGCL